MANTVTKRELSLALLLLGTTALIGACENTNVDNHGGQEYVDVGKVFSSHLRVEKPTPDEPMPIEWEYGDIIAERALLELRLKTREYLALRAVSEERESEGAEIYARHHVAMAGVSDEELVGLVAEEKEAIQKLLRWYERHGEQSPPRDEKWAFYGKLYPSVREAREALRQYEMEPPAITLFKSTGKMCFHIVVAGEQLAGRKALEVSEDEIAAERARFVGWSGPVPSDAVLRVDIKISKAAKIVDEYILKELRNGRMVIYDLEIKKWLIEHLERLGQQD